MQTPTSLLSLFQSPFQGWSQILNEDEWMANPRTIRGAGQVHRPPFSHSTQGNLLALIDLLMNSSENFSMENLSSNQPITLSSPSFPKHPFSQR